MSILEKTKIGDYVQINLELSKDRLTKEIVDAINISSVAKISDFRITDGKGIGVVLKLSNGEEQWFFENEIDILDEDGKIVEKDIKKDEQTNILVFYLKNLKYEKKIKISDLLNPINFIIWCIASFKDNF